MKKYFILFLLIILVSVTGSAGEVADNSNKNSLSGIMADTGIIKIEGEVMSKDSDSVKKSEKKPRCFFEISIDGETVGKIVFELYWKDAPLTCANFKALCTGEKGQSEISGKNLHYKGSKFHRIIPGFMAQGGDFTRGNGTGGESIYGSKFADENFTQRHTERGLLSMANAGPNTNGSQFFLTFIKCPWLDGKHVVFGKAVEGLKILDKLEECGSNSGATLKSIAISDCGICE